MPNLFEYGNWESIKNKNALEQMLHNIWMQKIFVNTDPNLTDEHSNKKYQPFLQFDGNRVRANNYIGFIQNDDDVIELYPKVFRNHFSQPSPPEKTLMLRHVFYWFNYCRKWQFPYNQVPLGTIDVIDFPELIINLIANQFLETISKQPLTIYQEVEETLTFPKGAINFNRYVNKSLVHGNFHQLECNYEPLLFDNTINRIIKYCSRLLVSKTKYPENIRLLQEVIFILDEVEDTYCSIYEIDKISLNSFFEDYTSILDSCKLILSHKLYSNNAYDLSQWCLLFPMEYIFEDFVAGFLEAHFSKRWIVEYQKSNLTLVNKPEVFQMQHDIYLTSKFSNKKIIIDTKYKLRSDNFKLDNKKGIAQSDLYQMLSYAFKRGCSDIILIYPNLSDNLNEADTFEILSGFNNSDKINVTAMEIPFWTQKEFNSKDLDDKLYLIIENQLNRYND